MYEPPMTTPLLIDVVIRTNGADPATGLDSAPWLDEACRSEYADAAIKTVAF